MGQIMGDVCPRVSDGVIIAHQREKDGAKQTLQEHLQGVADLSKTAAAKLGLAQAGELMGLLHDLGKYSKEFQDYINRTYALTNGVKS